MKRTQLLILILLFNLSFSQTHRFIYEYTYKEDSTSTDFQKENMTLDINPKDVKFYSYAYAEKDSINKVRNSRSASWDNNFPALKRERNSFKNLNFILIDGFFVYETYDKIIWKLSNETKKSGDYKLQKATTRFGGRNWIAWFSKEINLDEGPYKFRGLPGLIFEVADENQNFSFKLQKSWKLKSTYNTNDFLENFAGQKAIFTTEKNVQKKQLEYFNDPLYALREKFDPNSGSVSTIYGVKVTSKEQFKDLTKMKQERLRKEYNPIEIDKAVRYPEK